MRERAAQIGAALRLSSEPEQGTTVCVALPIVPTAGAGASAADRSPNDVATERT
jgi:signal transduction histidine kinase